MQILLNQHAFTAAYSRQLITIEISDADEEMVTAPTSLEEEIGKL
jgi:hypothetical protein